MYTAHVTLEQALTGVDVSVETLDGRTLRCVSTCVYGLVLLKCLGCFRMCVCVVVSGLSGVDEWSEVSLPRHDS